MACTDLETLAGVTISMTNASPATYDAAGYAALSFVEVSEVTSLPSYGLSYNIVTHDPLGNRVTCKLKGNANAGSGSLEFANLPADAGQVLAIAAVLLDTESSFKIEFQGGEIDYVTALVTSAPRSGGTSETVNARSVNLEFNRAALEVAAP